MRAELPSGTVTFLFTDIEGSTRLLHALGPEAYADALAEHRRLLRESFVAHGGVEVDTQGDAFLVAFPTAAGAAGAARSATEALAAGPIRVRMGLHTGSPTVTGEGYVGIDVHRGARVGALAHGGQTILSPATAVLLDDEPLRDLGLHRLKDFEGATRLFQLGEESFPPLRTPGGVDLPQPATRFLGREHELFEAVSLVLRDDPRVLTIVGPGGTGKTRFAIELARLLAEEADGATLFVPLAPLREGGLVLGAIAEKLGTPSPDPEALAAATADRRTHLVVDNAEHLLPDAASPLAGLVAAAPSLRLLVTSREPLRIQGEVELDLPPLAEDEAVALFVERSRAVRADAGASPAVGELCERLDRLPLALELAAARTKLLPPEQLLERIGQRLDLLQGTRDADARHATLRATIAWSYDLLEPEEQRLFERLSVFAAGATLESAEAVADAELDTLASLLDKSLVRRRTGLLGEERYWMLETIREFASERLDGLRDANAVRRRHAERMLGIARAAHLTSEDFALGFEFERVQADLDDIRAALDWSVAHDRLLAGELFVALEHLWATSHLAESERYAMALAEALPAFPAELRARVLRTIGATTTLRGDVDLGLQRYREALELFEGIGDDYNAVALQTRFAVHAGFDGDRREAERLIGEVRERNRLIANPVVEPQLLSTVGDLALREGRLDEARERFRESVAAARANDFALWLLWQSTSLAEVELELERFDDADRSARSALEVARSLRDRDLSVYLLGCIAVAALKGGRQRRAGILWGAASEALRERPPGRSFEGFDVLVAPLLESSDAGFQAAVDEGRLYTLEHAVEMVLADGEKGHTEP